ncbi:MAG: hypothetical protein KatS3mg019_2351 [Fimbriimonadales bacterium]|nr:MAG: hypothetical protein KatS3mg019_2351 [Fimbriimonadales bacterium]
MRWRTHSLLWRLGGLLLTLSPVGIIALAALMYLWQIKLAVEDSLPYAIGEYARRQADLEVRLERVSLSWRGALLVNAEVHTLGGERLLRARYLEVRLPRNGEPLTIELDRPEVWLQRDRRGVWNIDPLLQQPRPPEPTPITLRVIARQGVCYFDDFYPRSPVRATVWAHECTYSQPRIGAHLTLRGASDTLGNLEARAFADGQRWLITLHADNADLTQFKPYLPTTPFDIQQAAAKLSMELVYEPNQPIRAQGIAQGIVQNPTYRGKPLPHREAEFHVAFTEAALNGYVRSRDGKLHAEGFVDWSRSPIRFAAQLDASGDDAAAWQRLLSDAPPLAQGKYQARLRIEGDWKNPTAVGEARLQHIRTPQGDLTDLSSLVYFTQGRLLLPDLRANYAGRPIRGKLALDTRPQTPQIRLYASASQLPLNQIPALREQPLRGVLDAAVIAYGDWTNPTVEANLFSDALSYNGRRLGGARARVRYANGHLQIPLVVLQGAAGLAQIAGEIRDALGDEPRLDLSLDATELDLNLLAELLGYNEREAQRVEGVGYLTAQVRGSLRQPEAVAEAVIFDGRLGEIGAEITVANLNLLGRELRIAEIQLLRRAAQLIATGVVSLPETPDQSPQFQLQGDLYDFDLATIPDWLRRELPIGGVASGAFTAQGEPEAFTITTQLNAESLQIDQTVLRENHAQLSVHLQDGVVQAELEAWEAQLEGGALIARGQWRSDGAFQAHWQLQDAPLSALAPYLPAEYRLSGLASLSGEASGTLEQPHMQMELEGKALALNGALLGDLQATLVGAVSNRDTTLHAQLAMRTPEGEVRVPELAYNLEQNTLTLNARAESIAIEWLRRVANTIPNALPPDFTERVATLQGIVQAELSVQGALNQPTAMLTLNAEQLEWRQQPLGSLSLQASWQGESDISDLAEATPAERASESLRRLRTQRAELAQLRWQAENARLEGRGAYTPDALSADFEIAQLPLRWARLWEPVLPAFDGALDLSLIAEGSPESPELTLSATVNNLTYENYTIDQILFSQIDVRDGAIQTDDALIHMREYQARLSGRVPFHWSPLGVPDDEPLQIQARLREQPLTVLGLFAPIDPERTQGTVDATLEITGTLADWQPRGQLQIADGALGIENLRTALQEIGLVVEFDGREARIVQAQARSSEGGALQATGVVRLNEDNPVADIRIVAESFTVNEPKLPLLEGNAQAVVSGTVQVQGALTNPQVQGALQVQRGFLYLPPEFTPREGGEPLPIDPRFDLRVAVVQGFTLRNPNLDTKLEGAMQVGGSLQAPTLTGEFSLRSGALSLPTARLRIEPDSVARLNYPFTSAIGETIARIDLDVRASTSVVAPDFTGDPIRYRVEVDVRGPLDDPEQLQLTARSDPPGLSEQRILSLLGRGQVLAAIARGANPTEVFREQLGDILSAQVLPGLFAPIETGIAEAFNLEQFSLDYTGLRPASLYLVKNLFNGVGIAYRRGIGVTNNEYQVRLFYRLPFRNRLLQRLRIGFGFDHTQTRFVFIEGSVLFR